MPTRISAIALVVIQVALPTGSGLALPRTVQDEWQRAVSSNLVHEPVVGLLDVPNLIGNGCGTDGPASVAAYATPSSSRPLIGSITMRVSDRSPDGTSCASAALVFRRGPDNVEEVLPTDESGYEVPALVVYQRSGPWFRVALQRGSAWLQGAPADFRSYPELLVDRLSYLRKGWEGKLCAAPGGVVAPIGAAWKRYLTDDLPVTVLNVRRIGDDVWVEIRLEAESCGEKLEGVSPATGWVPAYRPPGTPSMWFYSRGC